MPVEQIAELRERVGRIVIGYIYAKKPVTVSDLRADAPITIVLKDAHRTESCTNA